ncbi:MAG: triose-phosphate isomerase [Bacteroidetes bacterium]|nr:triose-phosphate isomerase [Bacteroidota bacterium]
MRTKIIAGNWKMNLDYAQAMSLVDGIIQMTDDNMRTRIVLAPPFPYLAQIEMRSKLRTNIFIAAQNCSDKNSGAFTGEVSASMLRSIGVESVIIGHSERRIIFGESDEVIAEKTKRAIENELQPIFCCGESLEERKSEKHFDVVRSQLSKGLFHLSNEKISDAIIAYEPVWAIGTGVTATAVQAQEMHLFVRNLVSAQYGSVISQNIRILYGGSVNAKNAAELFGCPDVDGALVGGASLKPDEFAEIIKAMEKI